MSAQIIPLTNSPNQSLQVSLAINGGTLTLNLTFSYNEIAQFWAMGVFDSNYNPLVSAVPLLTGQWPGANVLAPYEHLKIGAAYVIAQNGAQSPWPTSSDLGSQFYLLWSDNT